MTKRNIPFVLTLLALTLFTFSCKKDDNNSTTPTPSGKGTLMFHFHPKVGADQFDKNKEYKLSDGTRFQFETVYFYVSGTALRETHGGAATKKIEDNFFLVHPGQMMYSLGEVEAKEYHGFTFNIGVDKDNNHKDPATFAKEHALAPKVPSMHWSWKPGYRFLLIEGKFDKSADNKGAIDQSFKFHIGTDALLRSFDAGHDHFTVASGTKTSVNIEYDLLKLFNNIDLKKENMTHTMNNMPLAKKMADNAKGIFKMK